MATDFGFTDDPERVAAANKYREAAIADGWSCNPTYRSEDVSRAASLQRDGFRMSILARDNAGKNYRFRYEAAVNIWGPDGLAIMPPAEYDWNAIIAGARTCNSCGATDVDTERYSFAGRGCAKCLPEMRRKHERPGWND